MSTRFFKGRPSPAGRVARFGPDAAPPNRKDGAENWIARALTPKIVVIAAICVLAALALDMAGIRPLPYRPGTAAPHPIRARVDFVHDDPETAERIAADIRRDAAHTYDAEPEWREWMSLVFSPVHDILHRVNVVAHETETVDPEPAILERISEFAASKDLDVTADEIAVLFREIAGEQKRSLQFDFYEEIVSPAYRRLREDFYNAGVLSSDRYAAEKGRSIRIRSNLGDRVTLPVGSPGGPISLMNAETLLTRSFIRAFPAFTDAFRRTYAALIARRMTPTLEYNIVVTQERIDRAVDDAVRAAFEYERGDVLIPEGATIERDDLALLAAERAVRLEMRGARGRIYPLAGKAVLLFAAALGALLYLRRFEGHGPNRSKRFLGVVVVALVLLAGVQTGLALGYPVPLAPIGLAAGLAALVFGPRGGVVCGTLFAFAAFLVISGDSGETVSLIASSWTFACLVPNIRHRSGLVKTAAAAGAIGFFTLLCWDIAGGADPSSRLLLRSGRTMLAWIGGGVALTVALPLLEKGFGAASNITLLELSDQEHPCLRKLVLEAPGTYHHSVVVGALSESAAEAVGANPLLARVASYYHDIGKITKPEYYTENDSGRSRHDYLAPSISALIIIAHVKDGAELARLYGLPRDIRDIIVQHHGDSLVTFFHDRARERAEDPSQVAEAAFRYPGPKPQSREAAIVLLADSVEAASRSLSEPTPAHIRRLVHNIVMQKLTDRQLDASDLTFRDVAAVEESFVRTLNAMFHSRVRYPSDASKTTPKTVRV